MNAIERMVEATKNFPQELVEQDRWCNWKEVPDRKGVLRKKPLISTITNYDIGADPADEETWSTIEEAIARASADTGIGYFFKPPYVGIDIDNVEDEVNRHLAGDYEYNIVSEFIHAFDSYTEISVSGTGIHIIIKGNLPDGKKRTGNFEMYTKERYFVMTGNSINGDEIVDHTDTGVLEEYYYRFIDNAPKVERRDRDVEVGDLPTHDLSDEEVVEAALRSKQGVNFGLLYDGNYGMVVDDYGKEKYTSQSEADLAFSNMLAYWTARDGDQMDSIFRESGLMRDKWDEMRGMDTYGDMTIDKSLELITDVYNPNARRAPAVTTVASDGETVISDRKKFKDKWKMNNDEPTREDLLTYPAHPGDDTGNADRIIDRYGDILKYNAVQGKFYIYNGQFWEVDQTNIARSLTNYTVLSIEDEDWAEGMVAFDEDSQEAIDKREEDKRKHISRSRSRAAKANMLDLAQVEVPVLDEDFDVEDHLLNVENGHVDLRDGSFHRTTKEMMFSLMAEVEYDDTAVSERWLEFVDLIFDGDQELIDFVQRCAGYSLTGDIREEVLFVLLGDGSNGKSTFLETLTAALGTYTNNLNVTSLGFKRDGAMTNDWAKLKKSRLVTTSEPGKGFVFNEGQLKDMTGGDKVSSRFLFEEEFDYRPKFKLWMATNHKPNITGGDDGIWRRFMMIPFNVKFEGENKDDTLKRDLREDEELRGVLQWAIEGAVEWYKQGLNPPRVVTSAVDEYRSDMDILGKFIEDHCEIDPNGHAGSTDLWNRYSAWVDSNRYTSMNRTEFGQELLSRFNRKQVEGRVAYEGIVIKQ